MEDPMTAYLFTRLAVVALSVAGVAWLVARAFDAVHTVASVLAVG